MQTLLASYAGTTLVLGTLLFAAARVQSTEAAAKGLPVYLTHTCSAQEMRDMGDSRDVRVRFAPGGVAFVNNQKMTSDDARLVVAKTMRTRYEPVVWVSGSDGIRYEEFISAIGQLRMDTDGLILLLSTPSQTQAWDDSFRRYMTTRKELFQVPCGPWREIARAESASKL